MCGRCAGAHIIVADARAKRADSRHETVSVGDNPLNHVPDFAAFMCALYIHA